MSEKPILFSGEMVRALLAGRKTQTRRVIKPQPDSVYETGEPYWNVGGLRLRADAANPLRSRLQPGDTLWVRESWDCWGCMYDRLEHTHQAFVAYRADNAEKWFGVGAKTGNQLQEDIRYDRKRRWRSAMFMPRWAARIFLRVLDVRAERLQDISESDAKAEGVERPCERIVVPGSVPVQYQEVTYRDFYADLWDKINGKSYPWSCNPWVWVYTFERIEPQKGNP